MPLVLISGYPSSGKTYRSNQLLSFFRDKIANAPDDPRIARLKLHHIDDQSLGLSRDVYHETKTEKNARAAAYSAVKRMLSRDDIVIADGMNYIKGYRYQLYCEAKALQTPSCVVHIGSTPEQARTIHTSLPAASQYSSEDFENLIFRYEEPNGMSRWDSPCFIVAHADTEPPCEAIWEAIVGTDGQAKVARPNAATVLKPAAPANYLYELDRMTNEVLKEVQTYQADHPGEAGGTITVKDADTAIELPASPVSLPQLQRLRRQFIQLNRMQSLEPKRIRQIFIDYLNDQFERA